MKVEKQISDDLKVEASAEESTVYVVLLKKIDGRWYHDKNKIPPELEDILKRTFTYSVINYETLDRIAFKVVYFMQSKLLNFL